MPHTIWLVLLMCISLTGCANLLSSMQPKSAAKPPTVAEQRQNYLKTTPNLDERTRDAISKGLIIRGMRREDVRASVGRPADRQEIQGAQIWWRYKIWRTRVVTRFVNGRQSRSKYRYADGFHLVVFEDIDGEYYVKTVESYK